MKLALYNSCLLHWEPERLLAWAADQGFQGIELHGGPRFGHVDWSAVADGSGAKALLEAQDRYGVPIVGLMYGALPFLSPDPSERNSAVERVKVLLRAAARLGVPVVSTFTGRDPVKTLEENLDGFAEIFPAIADMAESYGVKLAFENCPMYEFWPPVHNIAVSPTMWRAMFELVPSPALGLNLDPSHLVWQGVDYAQAAHDFSGRIFIAQAKDTERLAHVLRNEGMLHHRWWRHRIPGQGEVDWSAFLTALQETGYDGFLSIEHEDPVWTGSDERVTKGLLLAKHHLECYL